MRRNVKTCQLYNEKTPDKHVHTMRQTHTLKETKEIECLTNKKEKKKETLFGKATDPRTNVQRKSVHYISEDC